MGLFDGQAGEPKRKGSEDKGFFESAVDNIIGGTFGAVRDAPAGIWNLGKSVAETGESISRLPGTTISSILMNNAGVDEGIAEAAGEIAGRVMGSGLQAAGGPLMMAMGASPTESVVDQELLRTPTSAEGGTAWQMYAKKFPALAETQDSFERTYNRAKDQVGGTVSGDWSETPYVKAWNEGQIVPVLMEDVGNVGMVAELGGGALGRAAQVGNMSKAGTLADRAAVTAQAPVGLRGAGAATEKALGPMLAPVAPTLERGARALERAGGAGNAVANLPYAGLTAPVRVPLRWAREADRAFVDAARKGTSMLDQYPDAVTGAVGERPFQGRLDNSTPARVTGNLLRPVGKWVNEAVDQRMDRGAISREARASDVETERPWIFDVDAAKNAGTLDERIASSYLADRALNEANLASVQALIDAPDVVNGQLVPPTPEVRDARAQILGPRATAGAVDVFADALQNPDRMAFLEELRMADEKARIIHAGKVQPEVPVPEPTQVPAGQMLLPDRPVESLVPDEQQFSRVGADAPIPEVFHGSSRDLPEGRLETTPPYISENLVGPGLYTTDTGAVAGKYRRKVGASGKNAEPAAGSVYRAEWAGDQPPRVLDLEETLPPDVRAEFERTAHGIDRVGGGSGLPETDPVIQAIRTGTGAEAYQALRGLMRDFEFTRATADEFLLDLNYDVMSAGYDAMLHTGGVQGGRKHNVYVWLDPTQMSLSRVPADAIPGNVIRSTEPQRPIPIFEQRPAPDVQQPPTPYIPDDAIGRGWAQGYGERAPISPEAVQIRATEGIGYGPLKSAIADTVADVDRPLGEGRTPVTEGWVSKAEARTLRNAKSIEDDLAERRKKDPNAMPEPEEQAILDARDEIAKDLENRPEFAPAAQRPQLAVGRRVREAGQEKVKELRDAGHDAAADLIEQLTQDAEVTLAQVQERGTLATSELRGGLLEQRNGRPIPGDDPLTFKPGSSRGRGEGLQVERDLAPRAYRQAQDISLRNYNNAVNLMIDADGITGEQLAKADPTAPGFDPVAVAARAEQARLVGYDRTTRKPVSPAQYGPETLFVPEHLVRAIDDLDNQYAKNADSLAGKMLEGYDKSLNVWKTFALGLSPRWNVGNLMGNVLMVATMPGALSPQTIGAALRALSDPEGLKGGALRVTHEGFNEAAMLRNDARGALGQAGNLLNQEPTTIPGKAWGGVKSMAGAGYKVNQFIDDMSHQLVYQAASLDGQAKRRLASELEASGAISKEWADEMRGRALTDEQAVGKALKVAGDFANLSKAERHYVRRLMPFFPWYKHITKLAWTFPLDHPLRAAWAMHLADMYGDGEDRPEWLRGAIEYQPGQFMRLPLSPFTAGVDSALVPVDPETGRPSIGPAIGALTPMLSTPASLSGLNLYKTSELSRPQGQEGPAMFGQYPYILSGLTPQTRLLADIAGPQFQGRDVVRYDTGDPRFIKGKPMQSSRREFGVPGSMLGGPAGAALGSDRVGAPLLSYATGVTFDDADLGKVQRQAEKQEKRKSKEAKRYDRQRNRYKM